MDHIPLPQVAFHQPLQIPYIHNPDLAYDFGDFHTFPARNGWDLTRLYSCTTEDNSHVSTDLLSFFQSWCFVGFTAEILRTGNVSLALDNICREEFGKKFLTTASLPRMLKEVALALEGLESNEQATRMQDINDAIATVDKVTTHISSLAMHPFSPRASWKETPASLVYLSVITLVEYLDHFAIQLMNRFSHLQADDRMFGGRSKLVDQRMLDAGWCANEVARLTAQGYRETTRYYLGFVERPSRHEGCHEEQCRLAQIDERAYRTRHVAACTEEQCPFVDVDVSSVVRAGEIPILTAVDGNNKQPLKVCVASSRSVHGDAKPYVAISHVWSDGLGNPHRNALPACQILTIQRRANALYHHENEPPALIPFWIDTLCVPLEANLRKTAIISMRKVYSSSAKLLILDASVARYSIDSPPLEQLFALATSTWLTRLWTYQEAALTRQHYYQFASRALTTRDIKSRWTSSSSPDEIGDISTLLYFNATVLVDPMSVFTVVAPTETALRFRYMANSLIFRTTSRASDEAICLAGILDRDVTDIVTLHDDRERIARLLMSLDTVPDSILFANRPRQRRRRRGEGWIPMSFLGGGGAAGLPAQPGVAVPTEDGLVVDCEGLLIAEQQQNEEGRQSGLGETESVTNALVLATEHHRYYVTLPDRGSSLPSLITRSNARVGILLKDPIQFQNRYWGALVEISDEAEEKIGKEKAKDGILYCRYEAFVFVARDDMSECPAGGTLDNIKGRPAALRPKARWCVG